MAIDDTAVKHAADLADPVIDIDLASGIRDTARSLHISTNTALSALKKKEPALESVNTQLMSRLNPDEVRVDIT